MKYTLKIYWMGNDYKTHNITEYFSSRKKCEEVSAYISNFLNYEMNHGKIKDYQVEY